ncbi:MAG TPA: metallopeptidase family protein [Longimicrobiaceae bacterium]
MDFQTFEARAREIFESVPERFLEGIDGLEVSRRAVPHPSLPEVYTLGECLTEQYPSEFGGAGEVRSVVVLYYGSFLELSRIDEDFDWEAELYETITHEVRHHLESLATEDELEEIDYAEDQNFRRREGERFDPFFYRSGARRGAAAWEVDGDLFLEVHVERERGWPVELTHEGRRVLLERPEPLGEVHFLTIEEWSDDRHEVVAVLLPRRRWWEWLWGWLRRRPVEVREGSEGACG